MRKPNQLKRMVPLLLPVVLIIGVLFFYYHGKALNASTPDALVSVTVGNEAVQNDSLTTEKETVELTLQAKETDIFELPYDDTVSIVPLDEEGKETNYPQLSSSDFKKTRALELFEERMRPDDSSDSSGSKEAKEEKATIEIPKEIREANKRLPYYKVNQSENKGHFYFELEKDQVQRIRITRLTKKKQTLKIQSLKDKNNSQEIVTFQSTEQLTQPETEVTPPELPEEANTQEQIGTTDSKNDITTQKTEHQANEPAKIDPQATSITDPFKVQVDIGRSTGLGDGPKNDQWDSTNDPGYDKSPDNDIVRTFDQVSYEITAGISNMDDKYASLKIRLDCEMEGAWRKDSSGQVRQTAEFAFGTLTDTGNETKKSTLTSHGTFTNSATGQAFFTPTLETFGGVNGDQLNPKFKITIETATLKDGSTEDVNQVIDGTVRPQLNDTVTISAKPLVDVNLAWTPKRKSNFEKTTGTDDKPFCLVTNVAAYAQLKPLPGRSDITSIKGSTYPVGGIEYSIDQKQVYKAKNTSRELDIGTDTDPVQVIAYDGLPGERMLDSTKKFTAEFSSYSSVYTPLVRAGLAAPAGYTNKIYPPGQTYNPLIGIYNTGNPTVANITADNSIKITNNDYTPIDVGKDKWLLAGGDPLGSNVRPFSVVAMQTLFPYEYLEKQEGTGAVSVSMDYHLSVSKIYYEGGKEQKVDNPSSSLIIGWNKEWPGGAKTYSAFLNKSRQGLSSGDIDYNHYASDGDGVSAKGNQIWGSVYGSLNDMESGTTTTLYGRWNGNSLAYDKSRTLANTLNGCELIQNYYGVGPKTPDLTFRSVDQIENTYSWYTTVAEAEKQGEIVATKTLVKNTDVTGASLPRAFVPLKVIGDVGAKDQKDNPNVLLTNMFIYGKNGQLKTTVPNDHKDLIYKPSEYKKDGTIISQHSPKTNWGDTLYIAPMTIRPTITTNESTYAPDETVTWTVDGKVESGSENNHKVQFTVTIPKETQYISGTAKDHLGNPLPDPKTEDIIENGDGTWTLKWILDYKSEGNNYNPKIIFDTSIVSSKLEFELNVAKLSGKVIADVWLEDDKSVRDTSKEEFRTSTKGVTVTNSGVIVVNKVVDKPYIESGNKIDPAKPTETHRTDFTYTVSFKNHSAIAMENVRVLDVLPYMANGGDGRGTKFNGDYSLVNVNQSPGGTNGVIWYTENDVGADQNPNLIKLNTGWYKLGTDMSVLKNAKSIMVIYDKLDPGKDMSFSLTIRPNGQKAGDKYVNAPSLNSHLEKFVQGVPSTVRVYGRDLSGVAWYDDNLDGLIGNKPSGGAEEKVKDIPVKLYRTSLEVPSYKNKLVEESLTGEPFIDSSGNSLVKTDEYGEYLFENLPEGKYIAEFIIGDKVVQREVRVTKKEAGSDESLNSKADQTTYKTKDFAQPILSEVAGLGATDSKNHVEHVNLGLIRPSTIRLFKYATGTAIDGDGDGKLSEAEKATGTPLKNAEFEVYEGDASSPFAKETTDESGNLSFVKLFPGEHTLVETKAPEGYELIKSPIKVTITEGNQTIQVYQEDDKKTDLPFTGGTGPMLLLLIIVSGMGILGLGGLYWYYRQPSRKGEG
ncbi:SpaA isopeptide-forming pilin-related protein [Enterococcus hulanensis]|uniref:SpaA isopeptide-forming pilin-related protein n=1 Tax=Enterococcus hulanensis TaxID=2559929 RepID=UPI0028920425|nr:SpaA isopeptide-forming pilin-related protein [Enterococcus hulanensis]MDT2658945.1 SpaA isopeptide-forming pilin-related protein [Enterococcus hulanensis]